MPYNNCSPAVYLNKVYEKYIFLVRNSAILNPMNKYDKLLVIDPKLLIGSSIHSNDFNDSPITDEEDLWFWLFYREGSLWRVWRCDRVWRFFQSISITTFRGGLCVLASHPVTPSHLNKLNILMYILKIKFYSSSFILIRHSCSIIKPLNPPCGFFFPNRSFLSYL